MDTQYVTGLDQLLVRLQKLADVAGDKTSKKAVSAALRVGGKLLQQDMQRRVRVKTGTLRENIIVTKKRTGDDTVEIDVTIRFKAKAYKDNAASRRKGRVGKTYRNYGPLFYARFLEFGTSKMHAFPFMRPSFESNKEKLPQLFRESLSAELEKVNQ